ncbi:HD domain-containing protein [Candidatus Uhrbacteria bacterium]|nr:HD domain-containing protein [Candidatus Uhrbacteria bacterium]
MRNPFATTDPAKEQQDILFNQDKRLLEPANELAMRIKGMGGQALLVGGFVRDSLTGTISKDADIEVYGIDADTLEQSLQQMYPGKVDTVGRSFGVLKVFLGDGLDLDVSIPRRESKTGAGHTGFAVTGDPTMSVKEAARRRDFTMNSLAADPLTGEIFDSFGGVDDIKKKILRVTDPERFQDDPLRVYRAVQFAARLGFTIEPKSFELMKEMVARGDLDELSPERVTEELKKLLLKSEQPSIGFEYMRELGIIERDYPELQSLIGVEQEPEWHPEGDVWIHTMMVLDAAARITQRREDAFSDEERLQVLVGALVHDLGKPPTTKRMEKHGVMRITSLGHEEAGVEPTKHMLGRFMFGEDVERAAIAAARDHLKPGMLHRAWEKGEMDDEQYANALRKWLKRSLPISWRVLLAASESDYRGRTLPGVQTDPYAAGEHAKRVILERHLDKEAAKPLVQGRDLIALGLKPGPQFGRIIDTIEHARDEGRIKSREEALELAKELISEMK